MDDSSVQKVWERPWSTEEMRAHCSSWNLAGDAGLLKHLQEFSQNLMQKTHTAEVALDSLLEDMRNTSVDVQNATNALLMLSNNQFVENRVYDDCEDEKEETDVKGNDDKTASNGTAGNGESALIAKAAEAILLGMSVIDTKFDCVEVPASDSEGEEDVQNDLRKSFALVLEPRNPYALQPLPHLIGSKEFTEDDRVGLGGDEDEEEEDDDDDVHLSIGQDLVAQGLNDSGSSLAGDMGDEGLFDEDEVDQQRVPKASIKQAWESSSSNGSDDLVVENNVIRKKLKTNAVSREGIDPFGHDGVEGDIFGGKGSSSGDEFMAPVHNNGEPPLMPKKPHIEDYDDDITTIPVTVNHKKPNDDPEKKKKANAVKSTAPPPTKTHAIPSDNPFGPPKDEWKDDEDGDSIFAATDGIFSGGRGLFDDLEDPFMSSDRRGVNQFQPPSLPDKPPAFKGDNAVVPQESKGDIFGEEDDEQDVFSNILAKKKPAQQKQKAAEEEAPRKPVSMPRNAQGKDVKGIEAEQGDSWLFDDADADDPLWNPDTAPRKDMKVSDEIFEGPGVREATAYGGSLQKDEKVEEKSKEAAQPKLPVGARSFYAGGIDPFALGKKLTKELEDKRKVKQERSNADDSGKTDVSISTVAPEANDKSEPKAKVSEKKTFQKEPKQSPDSGSLFDDVDEGDDLFAPVNTKATKPKDVTPINQGSLFDDGLFASKKAPAISAKVDTQRKPKKKLPLSDVDNSKNLFGNFASDEDDDIFSSSNSLGSRSSSSKPLSNKGKKAIIDSSDPLFDDGLGKDGELFPGSLGKNIFTEKEVEDDLFSGFIKKEEVKTLKSKKKESSSAIKTEFQVPLSDDGKGDGLGDTGKAKLSSKTNASDNLFGPLDVAGSEKKDSKPSKKTEASLDSKEKPTSRKKNKIQTDDIFGDSEGKSHSVSGSQSVSGVPSIDALSGITEEEGKIADSKSYKKSEKGSNLENLFDDFENDGNDFLSSKKPNVSKSVQPPPTLFEDNSSAKKTNGKDLFSEFDSDGEDQKFSTPKGGKIKGNPLYLDDPLGQQDDLFSSLKPSLVKKTPTPSLLSDESLVFSLDSDRKKTEPSLSKVETLSGGKGGSAVLSKDRIPVKEENAPTQLPSGGSTMRKSPPKTLNLEKVIPSPKPDSKVVDMDNDILGSNDTEDDRIVEAWMKGHPPPLRDSKVETATEDDITPGYTPVQSYDDYGPPKNGNRESYFADIPSASLLRSHGKERARIQSHRRPPSRKVRKGSAASVDPLPVTAEDEAKPEPPVSLPSRDSKEEDAGSQGTIEEWSTPEAALASPPPRTTPPHPPPRSNPLSPSTDEEQDFFDVLPVGHHYPPPPMDAAPPSHTSPFSDALGAMDDVWDDSTLFEDAQPMAQGGAGGLWGLDGPPSTTPVGGDTGWTPHSEEDQSRSGSGSSKLLEGSGGGKGDDDDDDFFSKAVRGPVASGGKAEGEQGSKQPKKAKKSQGKKELGKLDDDLWGDGFSSRLKDDIFAEDLSSTRAGDFDDLFQGQEDLFGPGRASAPSQETKRATVGNVIEKSMGKSLSKLDSKSKAPVSLFDDDDNTEDLFSPHSSQPAPRKGPTTTRKTSTTRPAVPEQPTKSSLVKVAADDSIFEDPLMVLKRKD